MKPVNKNSRKLMRLSKKEKELLNFASSSSIGTITISSRSADNYVAESLCDKWLMKRHYTSMPFCGDLIYWSLTNDGWKQAKLLKRKINK